MSEYTKWSCIEDDATFEIYEPIKGKVAKIHKRWSGHDNHKKNAQLIVSAVNACISINPDNPQAVAEGVEELGGFSFNDFKQWLREQLNDLYADALTTERDETMTVFNKGLERKCALDTKAEKILNSPYLQALSKIEAK